MISLKYIAAIFLVGLAPVLSGCLGGPSSLFPKAETPIPVSLVQKMKARNMTAASPVLVRIFKEENVVEIWKESDTGRYGLLAEYEICTWSGELGPKFKEGDRQAPEGFYTINPWQMNPKSDYHLAFNLGFPNAFDRAHKRTGSHLMVHGACSSAGCYSMTDDRIEEIFALAREAFKGGQRAFQVHAFPFRMTPENLARHRDSEHFEFWKMLKEGYDHFEITKTPPKVDICDRRYVFNRLAEDEDAKFEPTKACPAMKMPESLAMAYSEKLTKDEDAFRRVLKKEAAKAAWRGEKPEQQQIESLSLASQPAQAEENKAASAAVTMQTDITSTGSVAGPMSVPVPDPAPRPQQTTQNPPGKRGFFGFFARGS
jgi:murein L,D-transpeptidase YafK